ncbi:MAG: Tim44/TimA family putative adaptor protein [Xanthobacteraceae bacterium]|uniref:Tim44/TimA family putative adaptor protein n=1 Tax=Pseudolabrys sp. TaxID=1960880 RepID=UPI003D15080B
MQLDLEVLTLIVVFGVALWKAQGIMDDLRERAWRQLHHAIETADETAASVEAAGTADALSLALPAAGKQAGKAADRLQDIRVADPAFDGRWFLDSARIVYETVLAAFAHGDREVLKDLLTAEVYDAFAPEIAGREARSEHVEFTFIGLDRADIADAGIFNGLMQITVAFESELVMVTRDAAGAVVDGDPASIMHASDLWTFVRDLASRSHVWKLAATETPTPPPERRQDEKPGQPAPSLGIA